MPSVHCERRATRKTSQFCPARRER